MISILIADDDLNKVSSIIVSIHNYYKNQVEIKQSSNVQEAIEQLQNNHFHLLISDLLMPLRPNEKANEKGGETLLKEIYKKKNRANTPIYIVGLTQYPEVKHNFSGVWKVWNYESENIDWQIKLRDLVFHISRVDYKIIKEKTETIFVEGVTDKEIIELSLDIFYPQYRTLVSIETISYGAGASWVQRQLIIWAKTLFWKDENQTKYLKAIGLFDNDLAGNQAIASVRKQIDCSSAESKTFYIQKLDRKFAKHLIPIFIEGIDIPITLEEMFAPFCWENAKNENWLVGREHSEEMVCNKDKRRVHEQSLNHFIKSVNCADDVRLYLSYKVDDNRKKAICEYVKSLPVERQKEALYAFSSLLEAIFQKIW